jgi:hypothetical protein
MEAQPPVEEVLRCGILRRLVQLLATSTHCKLQFEACWAITNIASTEHTGAVVEAGAVGPLVSGMISADPELREQSIWCIGNIAGDSPKFRDMILTTPNAIAALMANIQQPHSITLLRNATWTLSNFCRGKPSPTPEQVGAMVPALAYLLLQCPDRDVIQDAAWGLSYLTDGSTETVQTVLDAPGVAAKCVALMGSTEATVVVPALRVIGNFISGSDKQTQAACDAGALGALVPLLSHPRRNIKREAAWAVSNVAAGTPTQLAAVMAQEGLMPAVVGLLRRSETSDWNVRKEAAFVVSNVAALGAAQHGAALMEMGVVGPLTDLLNNTHDHKILSVVLDAVEAMLSMGARGGAGGAAVGSVVHSFEEAGLVDALEYMQGTAPDEVYKKCVRIIQTYYPAGEEGEEEEEAEVAAVGGQGGFMGLPSTTSTTSNSSIGGFGAAAPTFGHAAFGGGMGAGALSSVSSHNVVAPMFGFGLPAAGAPIGAQASCAGSSVVPQHFSFAGMNFS